MIKLQQRFALYLLLYLALSSSAFAQVVDIPDPNLRQAIREKLNLPINTPITRAALMGLTRLEVGNREIVDLTGLEFATELTRLAIYGNPITDLRPISNLNGLETLYMWWTPVSNLAPLARLTRLKHLNAGGCEIIDISPLASLNQLITLNLAFNKITDISALANLIHLQELGLTTNRISDASPLEGLKSLERLEIWDNNIVDHSWLNKLPLIDIENIYGDLCEEEPLPLEARLENRGFPSVISAWGGIGWSSVLNQPHLSDLEQMSQHDLYFCCAHMFGQGFINTGIGWEIRGNFEDAQMRRDDYIAMNPNMVFLAQIEMRETERYPDDSPYWVRDSNGNRVRGGEPSYLVNFTHPDIQDEMVQKAVAVSKCGLFDGIFIDWWTDYGEILGGYIGYDAEMQAKINIMERIRAETRADFLIMGNVNRDQLPRTGKYINGGFMETLVPGAVPATRIEEYLAEIEQTLPWLETNLRQPHINAIEGWGFPSEPLDSPTNLRWMRAFTTLSLTHSDGYVLFTDGLGHAHYWYDFWDADLGRPVGEKGQLYQGTEGLYIREFTNGWAVYNHSGEAQEITLPEEVQGVASGLVGREHTLPNLDGEMYLRVKPKNLADVNRDGVVNILDLVLVAQGFGKDGLQGDVNGDGVVNVFDLVQVAGALDGGGAAPSAYSPELSIISAADVEGWLAGAQGLGVGDANFQQGIRFLQQLLAALTPKETMLLPNYPNPFNPETWIAYHLAQEAEVTITIYDTKGTPVRRLALGNQAAGYYAARGKAAYWDGRNESGEKVASGIYIYQFRAGDYVASRRMVIVK